MEASLGAVVHQSLHLSCGRLAPLSPIAVDHIALMPRAVLNFCVRPVGCPQRLTRFDERTDIAQTSMG